MICSAFSRSGRTSDGDEIKMRMVGNRSGIRAGKTFYSPFGSGANGQLLPQSFRRMTLCVFARSARGRPCDIGAGRKATYSVRTSGANVPLCRPKLSGGGDQEEDDAIRIDRSSIVVPRTTGIGACFSLRLALRRNDLKEQLAQAQREIEALRAQLDEAMAPEPAPKGRDDPSPGPVSDTSAAAVSPMSLQRVQPIIPTWRKEPFDDPV